MSIPVPNAGGALHGMDGAPPLSALFHVSSLKQDGQISARRATSLAMNDRISAMCKVAAGVAAVLCAMFAVAFAPLPDADFLEPSVENEVEHALSRAYVATNSPSAMPVSTNNTLFAIHDELSKTDLAIWLVSMQKADGRWYDGTNDVTSAAIEILEKIMYAD